jgi:hypothetical protein
LRIWWTFESVAKFRIELIRVIQKDLKCSSLLEIVQ